MTASFPRPRAIIGTFFHAPTPDAVEVLEDVLIRIDETGVFTDIIPPGSRDESDALRLPHGTYGLPGMVDLHIHAPQYPQLGLALDEPLEVWLQKYTFPLEAKFADPAFARPRFEMLVSDLLANGTTTGLYFATQDAGASKLLADICIAKGQRALVGKVVMDDPAACPDYYRDASAEAAVEDTRAVIAHIRNHPENAGARVLPVVTPRFIPSCTDEALQGLGALAAECGCHVQSHVSESDWAHGHVLARYGHTDTEALERFGLLTRKTVLAHGGHLTGDDMARIAGRGAGVAHCPISNSYFGNAVFPLRQAMEKGVHVGLGTDISGGPILTMFEAMRGAVQVSRMLQDGVEPQQPAEIRGRAGAAIDLATAFHCATAGGGEALDLPIGKIAVGYKADLIAIDTAAPEGGVRLFGETDQMLILQKILYTATRANIAAVYVDGAQVAGK